MSDLEHSGSGPSSCGCGASSTALAHRVVAVVAAHRVVAVVADSINRISAVAVAADSCRLSSLWLWWQWHVSGTVWPSGIDVSDVSLLSSKLVECQDCIKY